MSYTLDDIANMLADLRARYKATLAAILVPTLNGPTGGKQNADGTGGTGPYYPVPDLDGIVHWVTGAQVSSANALAVLLGQALHVGSLGSDGDVTSGNRLRVVQPTPVLDFLATGAGADLKTIRWNWDGNLLRLETINDLYNAVTGTLFSIDRASNVNVANGINAGSNIVVRPSGSGGISVSPGNTSRTGYFRLLSNVGGDAGYIGYVDLSLSSAPVNYSNGNGNGGHSFSGGKLSASGIITNGIEGIASSVAYTISAEPAATANNGGFVQVWGSASGAGARTVLGSGGYSVYLLNETFYPFADSGINFGSAAKRIANVFAQNGAIQTSDATEKTLRGDGSLSPAELRVAVRLAKRTRVFQWTDAVEEKGADGARYHFGVLAQDVRDDFEAEGLDGRCYGALCFDEWPETPAIAAVDEIPEIAALPEVVAQPAVPAREALEATYDDDGRILTAAQPAVVASPEVVGRAAVPGRIGVPAQPAHPAVPAGSRWGVRPDQLKHLIIAGQEQRIAALEAASAHT